MKMPQKGPHCCNGLDHIVTRAEEAKPLYHENDKPFLMASSIYSPFFF